MARRASALKMSPNDPGDERRRIEAAQRDPRRFADLYEANFEGVYAYIVRRVGDRHEAEDLTADVFHQALRNIGKFEWRGVPFAAWLYRIAANEIADRAKDRGRDARATQDARATHLEIDPPGDPKGTCYEEIENRARLFRTVDALPAEQRRVIMMRFAEERSIREIAHQLRRSEGAVKQLQFRGLQNLRLRMGENDG
jgi:RNA polymerase sigma-70 factor (ECF subfamily)